jgi:hypothetical protein
MKSSKPRLKPERTVMILPPALFGRIRSHYARRMRKGNIPFKALEPFWRRYLDDEEFCDRMTDKCNELAKVVFDPENPSWGFWPVLDLEECVGLGLLLGINFEQGAEEIITELPEELLAEMEEKSRSDGQGLCDLLLDRLIECKEAARKGAR